MAYRLQYANWISLMRDGFREDVNDQHSRDYQRQTHQCCTIQLLSIKQITHYRNQYDADAGPDCIRNTVGNTLRVSDRKKKATA